MRRAVVDRDDEGEVEGVDYLDPTPPGLVVAFAQTNAGDMSPNLNLAPGSGPTDDEFENTRLIGLRQCEAAMQLATGPGTPVDPVIDVRMTHVDLGDVEVAAQFTGDGRPHRTGRAVAAAWAGMAAGSAVVMAPWTVHLGAALRGQR